MTALQADERARAVRRHADLGRTRRVVSRTNARDTEVRAPIVAVERDRLQPAIAREIDTARVVADEVRVAPALRRRDERRRAAGGRHRP